MFDNRIHPMGWELTAASGTGLTLDQIRFTVSMFVAALICFGYLPLKNAFSRHVFGILTGILVLFYPFGFEILHILPPAIITYFFMWFLPNSCGIISWVVNFSYLITIHALQASGTSWNEGKLDFTGGLMILVLKLIGLAVARQDSFKKPNELSPYQLKHKLASLPGPLEFASYIVGMGSLLSGPFYEFSDYRDFVRLEGIWSPSAVRKVPWFSGVSRAFTQVAEALVHFAVYIRLGNWNGTVMLTDWYGALPLWQKFAALTLIGASYQSKYYAAWKLAEAGYSAAGFDFEGYDPKTGKALWGRCCNANFLGVWTADSARTVPQNWNICTGKWLRRYVYERLTPRNRKPGFRHLMMTQLVCGLWHGLFPGYQLFFAGTAIWIYMSQVLYRAETHLSPKWIQFWPYRLLKIMWTSIVLNYLAAAFQLLLWSHSIALFKSVYFIPHVVLLFFCLVGGFVRAKRPPTTGEVKKAQ